MAKVKSARPDKFLGEARLDAIMRLLCGKTFPAGSRLPPMIGRCATKSRRRHPPKRQDTSDLKRARDETTAL
jgi:hypothetical protein